MWKHWAISLHIEIFLESYLPGTWQLPRLDNRIILPQANDSSHHRTDYMPVTVPPFPLHSHNILKADTYYVYSMNEATNSERWRDWLKWHSSNSSLLGFQNLPHHKSSFCSGSLWPWLQAQLQVSLLPGFRSRDSEEQLPGDSSSQDAPVLELHLGLWTSVGLY